MKLKHILICVLVLGLLALAGWWLTKPKEKASGGLVGEKLVSPDIIEATTEIIISDPSSGEAVLLNKAHDNTWILPEYHNFPADFSKLESLTRSLLDATVLRAATKNPSRIERLELGENRVEFKSAASESLWVLETGKRGPSGGTFVKLNEGEEAYLADLSLYLDTNHENWPQKKLLSFKSEEVENIRLSGIESRESTLEIYRESAESPFTASELEESKKINDTEVKNLLRTLINARFSKVLDKEDPDALAALDHSREIELFLFNGESYSLSFGRRPAQPVEKEEEESEEEGTEVGSEDVTQPEEAGDDETTDDSEEEPEMTDSGPVFIFFSTIDPENRLNGIMQEVALTYADYTFTQLNDAIEKLVEISEESEADTEGEEGE